MKTLLIVCLAFLSSCLFDTFAYAERDTGPVLPPFEPPVPKLELTPIEKYVLMQVNHGEVAYLVMNEENRTLSAAFLRALLTGTLPNLKVTKEGVRIMNAVIKEPLSLTNATIPFIFSLYNCKFYKEVNFRMVSFYKDASFYWSTFSGIASFEKTKFSGIANFNGATFSGKALFTNATFSEKPYFKGALFSGVASFSKAKFSKGAIISGVKFYEEAWFSETTFSEEVLFNWTTFFGRAFFSEVTFIKEVNFSSCDFISNSNFIRTLFYDKVNFSNVSGFSEMLVEWKYSPDKFGYVKKNTTNKHRELKYHLKYNETFYLALIKNYRDMGWFREADDCYYTYRVEKREHRFSKLLSQDQDGENNSSASESWWSKPMLDLEWLFLDRTFGYGVKPLKLLKTYLFLWVVFIPIYFTFLRLQYQYGKRRWYVDVFHKISRSTVHSVDTLTPGINLYAFTTLTPYYFDTIGYKKTLLNIVVRFQQLSGWYLAALFLILFSRVWIR